MTVYDVRYIWTAAGEKCRGYYAGNSKAEVTENLRKLGLKVISIKTTNKTVQEARIA